MKRVYESPVMMAEAFVANEYVAGCWTITCQGYDNKNIVKSDDYHTEHSAYSVNIQAENEASIPGVTDRDITLKKGGNDRVKQYDGHWGVSIHEANRPNASY